VANNVVYGGNSNRQTAEVGSKPGLASWVGAYDLSGNVWEWVSSLYQPYPVRADDGRENSDDTQSARVLRGGAWLNSKPENLRAADRNGFNLPSDSGNFAGFRCARSLGPVVITPVAPATIAANLPTPTPVPAVSANRQWKPILQKFDGVDLMLVPPGCFNLG